MKKQYIVLCGGLVLVAALALFLSRRTQDAPDVVKNVVPTNSTTKPHSFAECVAQGYPIQESQPRRCQAGKIAFVESADLGLAGGVHAPVIVEALPANAHITSPMVLHGKALGSWFFEASFPVRVLDATGNIVAEMQARADADWQTPDYVPFTVTLTFAPPQTESGFVEFAKDNPSGLPDLDASVRVPVQFK